MGQDNKNVTFYIRMYDRVARSIQMRFWRRKLIGKKYNPYITGKKSSLLSSSLVSLSMSSSSSLSLSSSSSSSASVSSSSSSSLKLTTLY